MPPTDRRAARAKVLTTVLPGGLGPRKRSKYRNVRTEYNGVVYQSKAESLWAAMLDLNVSTGYARLWIPQPRFRLGCPENIYVADFLVWWSDGRVTVDDVKGIETAKFRRDKKLWRHYGRCPLRIVRKGVVAEIIEPGDGATAGP
jgi:hypothetical protein